MRAATLLLSCGFAALASAADWPQWRGPHSDGAFDAPKLPAKWPAGGLRTVWKQPVGGGYAGISVADGRVFTLDYDGQRERVFCLDAASGRPLWSHSYGVTYGNLGGYANGPRTTPAVRDGKVYTLGAVGHLFCFDAKTGDILWKHDCVAEFVAKVPEWGFAASPVLDGDRLIVHIAAANNGCVMAFDRTSGKEVWRSLSDPGGYCTPVIIEPPSGKQVVLWTPRFIHGLDPASGKPLWKVPYEVTYGVSIAPPIYRDGIVFVTGYWEGSKAIRLGPKATDAEVIWTDGKQLRGLMAQPLYRNGHVFTMDRDFGLTCFELKTGKKLWDDDNQLTPRGRNPHASIVWINDGDRALALNAAGELVLCRLNPKGYEEGSRVKVLDGRVWGHPAFAGRFLYAKTDGGEAWQKSGPHELRCIELVKE
jgi:outer membrane protein assembly factor BamB